MGTDADILAEIERKCATILNAHVADVMGAFKEWFSMDLQEQDIEARISKYFVDFDRLVEEKDFSVCWDAAEKENLAPAVLQVDVKRLVEMTHRDARIDDVLLYLRRGRGRHQQPRRRNPL
ncbi:hypothetical protein PInf_017365 [Phytophthora infestans]|nr:hypothetical protein PInf_017365 [Phytophthora infestans]